MEIEGGSKQEALKFLVVLFQISDRGRDCFCRAVHVERSDKNGGVSKMMRRKNTARRLGRGIANCGLDVFPAFFNLYCKFAHPNELLKPH